MGKRWWAEAVVPRWAIARLVPAAGPGLVTALIMINLLLGLLPVAFVVATGVVIGRVPAAVAAGVGSAAWGDLVAAFVAAAATFVAQQALTPVQLALGELVKRRVDGGIHARIIGAALRSTGIAPMEDQAALDALKEASRRLEGNWETPGMACAGLLALIARYTRLAGYAVLVGVAAGPAAGLALAVAVLIFRYGNRGGLRRYSQAWARVVGLFRRGTYFRDLALHARAAKELRVFGLTGWLAERYAEAYQAWLDPVWRARRRIYLMPYLAYTALGLAVAVATFALLAGRAATGDISLTELAVGLQATVAGLLLGAYYPESDDATQLGMLSLTGLARFERRLRGHRAAATDPAEPGERAVPGERAEPRGRAGRVGRADSRDRAGPGEQAGPRDRAGSRDPAAAGVPAVRFERVAFRYPGAARDVLDGLDLDLEPGRCTALVGVNGAGKTTLVKLLTRLYEPTAGTISYGGADVREFDVAAWRRQVSVIFQDFVRYELSLADNIALGAAHAPRDPGRIRRAAVRAGLRDLLDTLPAGLDTPLSRAYAGGTELSGGQWQRVAIARSLYALEAGARVLILDEPTAALDVRAETEFFDRFVELTRGVTSLLISHRFSSVRRADAIAVIGDGRTVERGDHESLLAAGGRYARLFRLQAERFARGLDAEGQAIDPGQALDLESRAVELEVG